MPQHIRLLADYNRWMNERLYDACSQLDAAELAMDRGAFFGSILGTLNHLLVGDIVWLQRLARHPRGFAALEGVAAMPRPASLDAVLDASFAGLRRKRLDTDRAIIDWSREIVEADLDHALPFHSMNGTARRKHYGTLVLNLFNHQTHHRGQITTLLSQRGIDIGVTDLLALIPER